MKSWHTITRRINHSYFSFLQTFSLSLFFFLSPSFSPSIFLPPFLFFSRTWPLANAYDHFHIWSHCTGQQVPHILPVWDILTRIKTDTSWKDEISHLGLLGFLQLFCPNKVPRPNSWNQKGESLLFQTVFLLPYTHLGESVLVKVTNDLSVVRSRGHGSVFISVFYLTTCHTADHSQKQAGLWLPWHSTRLLFVLLLWQFLLTLLCKFLLFSLVSDAGIPQGLVSHHFLS